MQCRSSLKHFLSRCYCSALRIYQLLHFQLSETAAFAVMVASLSAVLVIELQLCCSDLIAIPTRQATAVLLRAGITLRTNSCQATAIIVNVDFIA